MNIFRLSREGFDIFHFHSSRRAYAFLTAVLFVKLLNKRVILSIHHGGFNEWLLKYRWRKNLYLFFFSFADEIVFMNRNGAERFKKISSIKDKRVESISPFIVEDEEFYRAKYTVERTENEFLVTTIGGWRVFYLTENVIEACTKLLKDYHCSVSIKLDIIAGTSEMSKAYKHKIISMAEEKSTDNFHVSTMENKEGIQTYLINRDVLVRPNNIDSYGLCVAEALMVGTPAIATDVCPRPSNAILYESNNVEELTRLLKSTLKQYKDRKIKKSMIAKSDDSYYALADLYNSL